MLPFTGNNGKEEFLVIIDDATVNGFKDVNGDIRYDKVLEWTLPTFGENNDVKLFDWQAA